MPLQIFRDPEADDRIRNTLAVLVAHCAHEANRATQSGVYSCAWRVILTYRVRRLPLSLDAGENLKVRLESLLCALQARASTDDVKAASVRGDECPVRDCLSFSKSAGDQHGLHCPRLCAAGHSEQPLPATALERESLCPFK